MPPPGDSSTVAIEGKSIPFYLLPNYSTGEYFESALPRGGTHWSSLLGAGKLVLGRHTTHNLDRKMGPRPLVADYMIGRSREWMLDSAGCEILRPRRTILGFFDESGLDSSFLDTNQPHPRREHNINQTIIIKPSADGLVNQETIEKEFPIKRQTAYLNNASYTPMFDSAISEVTRQLRRFSENGPDDQYFLNFKTGASVAREKLAALLNARAQGIVFAESATQSINLVANGFRFSKGDTIITRGGPTTEHPSDYLPWLYYATAKGVKIHDVPVDGAGVPNLAELDSAIKDTKAKMVVTSHVLYNLGTIEPAKEMCRVAHERGAAFFLDVSQSVGNILVDLDAIGCDFAAGTASKWLCGPLGVGFLYCRDDAAGQLEPLNFGANATEYVNNLSYKVLSGAARLQEGFRNWAYVYAFAVAMDVWSSFGLEEIHKTDMKLALDIVDRIGEMKNAYRLLADFHDGRRTCIIPVETINESPADVVQRASKARVTIAQREFGEKKILRISPHFYNDEREVERLFEVL